MFAHALRPMQQPCVRLRGRWLRGNVLYREQAPAGRLGVLEPGEDGLIPGALMSNPRRWRSDRGSSIPRASACSGRNSARSCWASAWLGSEPELPEEPELLGELEPHAAITVAAASAASAVVPLIRSRTFLQ